MHVLSMERRVAVVEHLTDGAGVRAASRLTGVHKTTILSLILKLGQGCERLHSRLAGYAYSCLLYTSPSPRDATLSRMPSSA